MSLFGLPVRRPVATSMFFVGIFVLGALAWNRIPVELFPKVEGNELNVSFFRPGSEPELVEREILLPLQARVSELPGVEESWGEIRGSGGTFRVKFRAGTDLEVRELDLNRLAAELARDQPQGTTIVAQLDPFARILNSGFAMFIQVTGLEDRNTLLDFVEERVVPRLAAVPNVSQVLATGGAPREVTVRIDPDLAAAYGVTPNEVTSALARSVQRLEFLGGAEDEAGRTAVVLDGRPRGIVSLANLRIRQDRPVLLRHVSEVSIGVGREESQFRVDGKPAVGLIVFQEEGANLVRLGEDLRNRLDLLGNEFGPFGLSFVVTSDGGEVIEEQVDRLKRLAASGFIVALIVLYLFLRQFRAVSVVGVAVPASLLCALVFLFLFGQSLNVITLFGLAVGIGMLVDNSIVVYEAVQRQLEHGASPDQAAERGVALTIRAILAATATNAVVFLPISFVDFDTAMLRSILQVLVLAILLPLLGSLIVAIGLVPLLARRLAAPAALQRIQERRARRESMGGWTSPDRARELFGGMLKSALRRPGGWITAMVVAVLLTVMIALPLVTLSTVGQEPPEVAQIQLPVEIRGSGSLESSVALFERLELAVMELGEGVDRVESFVQEESGTLTIHMKPRAERQDGMNAARVRAAVRNEAAQLKDIEITSNSAGGGAGGIANFLGQGASIAVLSGPDARTLQRMGERLQETLGAIPDIANAKITSRASQDEIRVTPQQRRLQAFGLTADQVLPILSVVRREGVQMRTGFTLPDGREIPLTVRQVERPDALSANEEINRLKLETISGVLRMGQVAEVRKMAPPPTITHHNGRRELEVEYTLSADAPESGPARNALEAEIREAITGIHRPPGYTVEAPKSEESIEWFKTILIPILLLLFAVLAITFESLTLPLLVLVSLPLTVLGATWALVISGMPAGPMALVGVIALIGLTVNPAILLVDRMQQHARRGGRTAGASALAAVRERVRPVLMTATTTVAGLWPLAIATGAENEIWPPFATVVMGGLVTSTVLTLLAIPVGFVFLHRLDQIFGRLGPWIVLGWLGATTAVMGPLIAFDVITSLTWQLLTTLLLAGIFLGGAVTLFRRVEIPEPATAGGPPAVSVRYLTKTYGQPGPIGRAWRVWERFAGRVLESGGDLRNRAQAAAGIVPWVFVLGGTLYLATTLQTFFWRSVFVFAAAGAASGFLKAVRRWRGHWDRLGRVIPGAPESWISAALPWVATLFILVPAFVIPKLAGEATDVRLWFAIALPLGVLISQFGRRTAVAEAERALREGARHESLDVGRLRSSWRRFSARFFGLDLPTEEVRALSAVHFEAERGMIGILGPNGAGKTTLLRVLAGILEPSVGGVHLGGVRLTRLKKYLARYIGYLPQDFGLPDDLTAREYLEYFALLYEIRPAKERKERVQRLLTDVGLKDKTDEKIGSYSGGMRQRVAVARTLLRLPPVIIVDEPTVGLDPRERIRFRNLLSRLAEGRIVLFSTHVVEDVEVACERVIVMAQGRKVFDDIPEHLSDEANGKVWRVTLTPEALLELPSEAMVVDEVPELDGRMRSRVLCRVQPHPNATPLEPSLEDGYLWLVEVEGRRASVPS